MSIEVNATEQIIEVNATGSTIDINVSSQTVDVNATTSVIEVTASYNPGINLPIGGATGQVLKKQSNTDYDTYWANDEKGVPYIGATGDVDLGEYELKAGQIELDQTPTGTAGVAVTRWNDTIGSTETTLKGGNVILKNGVDLIARVVNKVNPNTTLTKAAYQAVKISGAQGQRLAVALAQANNDNNSADTLGLVTETIPTNQEGFIMTVGSLEGINTTGSLQGETWSDGDVLYLSPTTPGAITKVKPNGSTGHIVVIGYVEYAHQNNGKIYVKIMNGWELDELHNVFISSPANNDALIYESTTSLWKNKSIATALGYTPVPSTRSLTINGTAYDLTADRTWSVGTVTSVALSVPTGLVVTSGSPITTSGAIAVGLQSGYSIPTTIKQGNWDDAYTFVSGFPTQSGNSGKYLTTDGSTLSWGTISTANIYNSDGTLTGNRTVTSGGFNVTFTGSNTAASAIARGLNLTHTLVAAANNDTLVGLDINPTFTNGAFTGVSNLGFRTTGQIRLSSYTSTSSFSGTAAGYLAFDSSGNVITTAAPSDTNIYNNDGTLTDNRVVSLDSKRLIFRDTNATLSNYTYSVGVPTGVTAPTWPSSFVYEGQYNIVPGTGPQIFNTRVWGRNTSATNNNLWVQETFADITSESTSFTNIYNQTFFTGRGSTLDTSTATAAVMRGIWSSIGHRYAGSQSTTVQINTNNIQSFYSTIVNYIGNVSNAYGYFSSLSQGSLTTSQTNTLTNHYGFYAEATIGSASGGSSTVTNYYGLFLNTPTVGATGVITNRWGVYAPDSAMSHYLNGNVVIGTTTLAGYKLDVSGTSRLANTLSSGFGTIISTTQTQANSTDVGDGAVSVSHSISATSATNELVIRAMSFGSNNNLTGGGAVTNHRVWNVASSTQAGSITTDLDQIFIERGNQANGTVTNNRAIRVNTMQGTNRAGFACAALTGTNNVYALLGTVTIPTGNWGIYQSESSFSNHFNGNTIIGGTTDAGFKLDVQGTGRFTGALTAGTNSSIAGISFPGSNIIDFPSADINIRYGGNPRLRVTNTTIFIGEQIALNANNLGNFSVASGGGGGFGTASGRILLGALVAYNANSTDSYFISIGHESLFSTTTPTDNIAIGGRYAGSGAARGNTGNHTSSFFFGTATGASTNSVSLANTYIIGNNVRTDLSNVFMLGRSDQTIMVGQGTSVGSGTIFQIDSTTKGFLPPRMTSAERAAISTPATGLIVYQTDGTEGLYENTSTGWRILYNTPSGGSGITRSVNNISTTTTAGASASTDYVYLISGTTTLTLPTAVGNTNRYTLKNVGTNTVTINTTSSQTIDGSTSITMAVRYTALDVISDGTNWNII